MPGAATVTADGLTLDEALRLALQKSDIAGTLDGGGVNVQSATSYDFAVAQEQTSAALAAFDTSFAASLYWNRFNGPPNSFFGPGIDRPDRRDEGTFLTGLTKRWAPGTQTRLYYNPSPGYLYFPDGSTGFNPNHGAAMELGVRQPLLQGAGRAVNTAPIVIAQLQADQSAWEFKRAMLEFVRSVEEAYWQLQAAHTAQQVIQAQLPLMDEIVRMEEANLAAQRSVRADIAKARTQQHALRQRQREAQGLAREAELRLRNLVGLDPVAGGELVLVTQPMRAPVVVDPATSVARALADQPLVIRQRIRTQIREMELLIVQNRYRPQFDLQVLYRANGLEDDLGSALDMMASQEYHDWEFGAIYSVPLGRNADRARMRAAELQLQRERAVLRETVRSAAYRLSEITTRIDALQLQYRETEARREQAGQWLEGARIRYKNPPPAGRGENWLFVALDDYLMAMRESAEAAADASLLLAQYNTELARLGEEEGTLLSMYEIYVLDDPCACAHKALKKLPPIDLESVGLSLESIASGGAVTTAADRLERHPLETEGPSLLRLPSVEVALEPELVLPNDPTEAPSLQPEVIERLPPPELGP